MAAPSSNGLSSSRRRHRSNSLRDSPDEDGGVEVHESSRLRDRDRDRERERGVVVNKKDRGDRERERASRSKRRRENRMLNVQSNNTSEDEESVNDEEEEDDENGGGLRMLPPMPMNSSVNSNSNNNNYYSQQQQQIHNHQHHQRKSFPYSGVNKVFRASIAAPKGADEMIGVAVPRKARSSASVKRSHEWVSGGGGTEQILRQSSTSPSPSNLSPAPAAAAPQSPSSSHVSVRKKMKANGGSKPRPPKSSSKSSSSNNPEELEIEIAEVLYGLMTQSQAPSSKKEISSPGSNSTAIQNSSTVVAPKRKKPRQVSENPAISSSIKTEISSSYLENSSIPVSAAENGFGFTTLPGEDEGKCDVLTKEETVKISPAVDGNSNTEAVITTPASDLKEANLVTESGKEEKFEIDLMAPPPQQRPSQEIDGGIDFSNHKQMPSPEKLKKTEDDNKEEVTILTEVQKKSKAGNVHETGESSKQVVNEEKNMELCNDFEKPNKETATNKSLHQALKHQQLSTKSEIQTEKTAQPTSLPGPMSVANWPPMGFVAPLQGVISMDGNPMSSAPIQPLFTHPRPKRCATHCYIARNIHYLQQFMKMNPFWPAASGPAAPMFGAKHANPNGMPSTELHASIAQSMQDKKDTIFPGHTTGKDIKSSQTTIISDTVHKKPPVLLQQAMPPVTPNNMLHGPAFIFPFNQQQAVAASASVRPGSSKLSSSTTVGGLGSASGSANSAAVSSSTTAAAAPALSFNYPNMSANETQYLAIMQNHPYAFQIPAVGGPPNYRGNHPHAQPMPVFNTPFYSSQMMHPSQIQQAPQQPTPPTQSQQTHQNSSGSTSSSQKHLQAQQRPDGSAAAAIGNGGGLHNSYPANHKSRSQQPPQARHLENEVTGGEDSPSTADSRGSRAATNTMSVYGHNFSMPVHSQNFAMMYPQAASTNSNDKKQQQSQQQLLKRVGAESSSLSPQAFAMSFAPMNGASGTIPMAQNHAIFQSLPESIRQSYHHMMTPPAAAASASAHHSDQKKDFRLSEEATKTTGRESSNVDEDRKGSSGLTAKSGQSIAFSRPDLATDASGSSAAAISGTSVIDSSSSRNIKLGTNNRSTRSPISTSVPATVQSSHHLHGQFQQQQSMNARSKNQPPSSNGSVYPDHLITSSSSMTGKFPNSMSSFPIQTSNTNGSPVQSPQWRNSVRGPTTSQGPSSLASATTSSLKYLHQNQQQQSSRSHSQSHTQISFGAAAPNQKSQSPTSTQMMQQQQNHNLSSNSGNQSPSPPMLVGSPTATLSSSQPKNSQFGTHRSSPSILGNPHNTSSNKSQQQQQQQQQASQQLHKQPLQMIYTQQQQVPQQQQQQQQVPQQQAQAKAYAQMMYTQPYIVQPPQAQQHSVGSTAGSGYYIPRKQQQSSQQQSSSSSAMLSLCPPVTLANTTTSDPAKAIAAATSNLKGGAGLASQQGVLHAAAPPSSMPAGPQYVHNATAAATAAAVQAKPAEHKQPAA
ncbi:hypothetical protein QVD17_28232 [Tagetes erecta]|uniref:Protein TIME FOR COFFEE n=1 Tax=Tagetes erecta TaxID=13708 RepID=A0AAD8K9Z8_TARER|nr:hypothetical protein QVD17_28232 [Tagetes erecta]